MSPPGEGDANATKGETNMSCCCHEDKCAAKPADGEFPQAPVVGCRRVGPDFCGEKAKVYFTRKIDAEHLKKLYALVNGEIIGKVAIKLHTGERHGPNILPRDMVEAFQKDIPDSTIVETNTLYVGDRDTTEKHLETLKVNGWTFCPVDIMDAEGTTMLPVKGGKHFKAVSMGKNIRNYDSMVVLTHFKGHAMGGFGGSMKNIAIGCASGAQGKRELHREGNNDWAGGPHFMERMVEGGKAVTDHFGKHITYLSVMRRMSVDCDCVGTSAAEPTAHDIGILASTDILAIDKAAIDMVYALPEKERHDLVERIESRSGLRQLSYMRELHMGSDQYELIEV